ncbi:MAG: T9SS type A sorting domain-containing protein [Flavobacteriales bacterium]|nr:T9SS type A sorting domain-containing protein [Flavobacteriales bacterium]
MNKIKRLLFVGFFTTIAMSTGFAQNGLNFDGVDDYISTNYAGIGGNSARTVEAWIKAPLSTGQVIITDWGTLGTGTRFTFTLLNGKLRVEIQGSGQSGTTIIADNSWHHVAVTYDNALSSNKFSLFIDGALEMTFDLATAVNTGSNVNFQIGLRVDGVNSFNGTMDEVRVWDYARSMSQISANMNSEFCGTPTGLVAYHKLNHGVASGTNTTETTSIDASGNSNDGTLNNFALTGATSNWVTGSGIISNATSSTQTLSECSGFSITVGTNTYSSTGVYTDVLTSSIGCDSTVTTDLTVATAITSSQTLNECAGFSITVGTNTYNTTGVYTDILTAVGGCDSTVTTDLTVAAILSSSQTLNECDGFSITVGTNTYNATGVYTDILTAVGGCDSTVTTDLTVAAALSSSQTLNECDGFSITVGTNTYNATGVYTDILTAVGGCDSTVTTDLTVAAAISSSQTLNECDGFSITVGTNTYNATGVYTDILTALGGCDSTVTTDLTVAAAIDVTTTSTGSSITASSSTATYRWLDCDNSNAVIAGETGQTFSPGANGNYAVELTEGSCVDTSGCESINGVGINENVLNHSISLYPNPTNSIINLVVADYNGTVHINVIDISGKSHLVISNSSANAQLDLSQLKSGVYFVQVTTALSKRSIKVIRN